VRVNTLKSTLEKQLSTTFAGFNKTGSLAEVMAARPLAKIYYEDPNIPNLLALPSKIDLSKSPAYTSGQIIFQDKASCFPAYLLDLSPDDGDVIDGCAAPGNKTTHTAAIVSSLSRSDQEQKVIAFERDKGRTAILQKMVKLASADSIVTVKGASDFIAAKPGSDEYANVGAILLDPSCSGTGIVGRDDAIKLHLPAAPSELPPSQKGDKGKKRKRGAEAAKPVEAGVTLDLDLDDSTPEETPLEGKLADRLTALSTFQLHILTHAMRFSSAHKITYSTCSIHFEENEGVVFQALVTSVAKERGWKILKRADQVDGLKKWKMRGVWEDGKISCAVDEKSKDDVLDACIRCDKGTEDGTMGFFVAAFVRDGDIESMQEDANAPATGGEEETVPAVGDDDEWGGFSDGEAREAESTSLPALDASKKRTKKKRKTGSK
jgi:putative methyltransferase